MIDICIISDGKTSELRNLTQRCIDGAINYTSDKVYVSESNNQVDYHSAKTFYRNDALFNYNRLLNELAAKGNQDYIAFCNNDLEFESMWSTHLILMMQKTGAVSASPWCPTAHRMIHGDVNWSYRRGYKTRSILAGWCFVMKRKFWQENKLPETYEFYCADNETEQMLRKKRAMHILVRDSVVKHLGSQTLKTVDSETNEAFTKGCVKKWNKINNENKFGYGV